MNESTPNPSSVTPDAPAARHDEMGILGIIGLFIGAGCVVMALAGVINTALDLELSLRISGARTRLPDNYETCAGLAVFGLLFMALSYFGSLVLRKFREAKGKPLVRVLIIVGALVLLGVVGRAVQVAALVSTYGSMLAYYCTDGDLEDVKAELADDPPLEDLDQAVWRAAQYDNVDALKLLLERGADLKASTEDESRDCVLSRVGPEFIQVALKHGVTPKTCPKPEEVVWDALRHHQDDDDKAARVVTMLIEAGWPKDTTPDHIDDDTPLGFAQRRGLKKAADAIAQTEAKPEKKKKKRASKRRKKKKRSPSKDDP